MTRTTRWRTLDAAPSPQPPTITPAPRRSEESAEGGTRTDRPAARSGTGDATPGDGPVDGWTDTDEYLSVEP